VGRPEKPVRTPNTALRRLAVWLRECRDRAGLSNATLANETDYSVSTIRRATNGDSIPSLPVVEAYARGCGVAAEDARRRWQAARLEEQRLRGACPAHGTVPRPELIREPDELRAALKDLHRKAGSLSYIQMERRAGGHGELPHTTLHRTLQGAGMLKKEQLTAYLNVCGVPDREHATWHAAWNRAWRHQREENGTPVRRIELQRQDARRALEVHFSAPEAFQDMERDTESLMPLEMDLIHQARHRMAERRSSALWRYPVEKRGAPPGG